MAGKQDAGSRVAGLRGVGCGVQGLGKRYDGDGECRILKNILFAFITAHAQFHPDRRRRCFFTLHPR